MIELEKVEEIANQIDGEKFGLTSNGNRYVDVEEDVLRTDLMDVRHQLGYIVSGVYPDHTSKNRTRLWFKEEDPMFVYAGGLKNPGEMLELVCPRCGNEMIYARPTDFRGCTECNHHKAKPVG